MKYLCIKRYKGKTLDGLNINLPAMSECELKEDFIWYNQYPLCRINSYNAQTYFVLNEDGQGELRGKLIKKIKDVLAIQDAERDNRWSLITNDILVCNRLKKEGSLSTWIWGDKFYSAPISDLKYICSLLKIKMEEE